MIIKELESSAGANATCKQTTDTMLDFVGRHYGTQLYICVIRSRLFTLFCSHCCQQLRLAANRA